MVPALIFDGDDDEGLLLQFLFPFINLHDLEFLLKSFKTVKLNKNLLGFPSLWKSLKVLLRNHMR